MAIKEGTAALGDFSVFFMFSNRGFNGHRENKRWKASYSHRKIPSIISICLIKYVSDDGSWSAVGDIDEVYL